MLRAPFDAVVVARYVDTGAAVDPTIRVVRLARVGPPLVRFAVPASEGEGILVGACIESGGPATRWRIARVAPEIDVASGTLTAEGQLEENATTSAPLGAVVWVRRCP